MPTVSCESSLKRNPSFYDDQLEQRDFARARLHAVGRQLPLVTRVALQAPDTCVAPQRNELSHENSGSRRGEADIRFKLL
jgi:hypothetical protein